MRVTTLHLCAHTGTHIDAPLHYLPGGASVEMCPLEVLMGPARVLPVTGNIEGARRLLFMTDTDLPLSLADRLVEAGAQLVGTGTLSIGDGDVHRRLLGAGICVVEGLDLTAVEPGEYDFVCLPLRIPGADGAPARAALRLRPQ